MSHYYSTLVKRDVGSATARSRSGSGGEVGNILPKVEGSRILSMGWIGGGDGKVGDDDEVGRCETARSTVWEGEGDDFR